MILAFHGSPGLPEDYEPLRQALSRAGSKQELRAIIRKGYPGAKRTQESASYYLGYSFGCADCVEAAAKDPNTQGVILIAPYLYPTKKPGAVMKLLLAIPPLSNLLLGKLGPKAMKSFIEKSAYPAQAPETYIEIGKQYAKPEILRTAMTETENRGAGIEAALSALAKRNIPVQLIWGKQDQTSSEAEQIAPLRQIFSKLQEAHLDQAGHALIWTHPENLANAISRFIQAN
jgi:pimeloyl-ACP methyl ester carboxylesterase